MPRQKKPIVAVAPDGSLAGRWDSLYDLCLATGKDRRWFRKSCNTGSQYLGRRWMWEEDYRRCQMQGCTGELSYGRQRTKPVEYRSRVAFTYDLRGMDDDRLVFLFKGATEEMLRHVFDVLSGRGAIFSGYEIREGHDVARLWRHQYRRLEVWTEGYDACLASPYECLWLIASKLRPVVGGDTDFYTIEDWLNLTDRRPEAVRTAWDTARNLDGSWQAKEMKKQGSQSLRQRNNENTRNNHKEEEISEMSKMYVRVPWYVAGFFRGRNEDRQLTEFDAYEFPDHDDLMLFMEHHLRFIPEKNQNVFCLSERAFGNILHGRLQDGSAQIIERNPKDWPTIKELCTLTGKFVTDKQESSDYLCIAIPKEILDGGRLHRTNGSYALPKKEADRFIAYLKQEFKREFEAFCQVDEMNCLENGINRSERERMERFLANYNMPISVDEKDHESLRKLAFRIRKRKNVKPYLRRQLNSFAEHISQEDYEKAERWEKKKEYIRNSAKNKS